MRCSEVRKLLSHKEAKINFRDLKDSVLGWLSSMRAGPFHFNMCAGVEGSLFTACFALFIFDLFGIVRDWGPGEKRAWISYINSLQDQATGYYIPAGHVGPLDSKPVHQLTAFCLSALGILGGEPINALSFLRQWNTKDNIRSYLNKKGCFQGRPTSGNMAMFLGIFLTYEAERVRSAQAIDCIETWFALHEETQNFATGFWGPRYTGNYYRGFQNAFHQFVIFNYWNRPILYSNRIVDTVLSLQDKDGHFGPVPGGGGCWDFDAADILINCGLKRGYRTREVEFALLGLSSALNRNQNADGGFCETRKRPSSIKAVFARENLPFIFRGTQPYLWYHRTKAMLSAAQKSREKLISHWSKEGRLWHQSNLWDTWFRCLTLAEISTAIGLSDPGFEFTFHRTVGLGYFKTQ